MILIRAEAFRPYRYIMKFLLDNSRVMVVWNLYNDRCFWSVYFFKIAVVVWWFGLRTSTLRLRSGTEGDARHRVFKYGNHSGLFWAEVRRGEPPLQIQNKYFITIGQSNGDARHRVSTEGNRKGCPYEYNFVLSETVVNMIRRIDPRLKPWAIENNLIKITIALCQ